MIEPGIYEHYKGQRYRVIYSGLLESTKQPVVVYEALYDNPLSKIWVRLESEFNEQVTIEGKLFPRFRLITNDGTTYV